MHFITKYAHLSGAVICSIALLLFLSLTNPQTVPVGLLIVPAVLLFLIAFCVSYLVLEGLRLLGKKPRKRRIVALVSATFITVVTILASTGGVSATDVILLALILTVVTIYIDKF